MIGNHCKLRVLFPDWLRWAIQDALLCGTQHVHVIEGAAHSDDAEVQALKLLHGLQLLMFQSCDQLVHVAVLVSLQKIAENHWMPQLVEHRQRILLESVGDHEGTRDDRLEPLKEVRSSREHIKIVHDIEDLPELDAMAAQGGGTQSHQLAIVRLLLRRHLKLLEGELFLHGEPWLGGQEAGHVAAEQPHCPRRLRRAQGWSARQRSG
mmetsp:Transcript_82739/g.208220  ORF Transcript_82739/g.208220 Transcript_82739/m.208220 type:complete len:208 (-) Transcript_82739:1080-1703(-)